MISQTLSLAVLAAAVVHGADPSKFSYDPELSNGPSHWAGLDLGGELENQCGGTSNSPIAVQSIETCDVKADYSLKAGDCTYDDLVFSLNDHGVKASFPDTCKKNELIIPGIEGTYEALQFHVHTSSEHSIDDRFYGAEMHIVHKKKGEDRYAVVGMMIEATNPENHGIFQNLLAGWGVPASNKQGECFLSFVEAARADGGLSRRRMRELQGVQFNVYDLVPEGSTFYTYSGGLTTPPCSEVVDWNLADTPVSLSPSQYNRLSAMILGFLDDACEEATVASPSGSTSRPPQPLNGRTVKRICPTSNVSPLTSDVGSAASTNSVIAAAAISALVTMMVALAA